MSTNSELEPIIKPKVSKFKRFIIVKDYPTGGQYCLGEIYYRKPGIVGGYTLDDNDCYDWKYLKKTYKHKFLDSEDIIKKFKW